MPTVNGKRKREDIRPVSGAKRPANQVAKQKLAKTHVDQIVTQTQAQDQPAESEAQRVTETNAKPTANSIKQPIQVTATATPAGEAIHVQIITGSYERILQGAVATIPRHLLEQPSGTNGVDDDQDGKSVTFSDTFLFAAHASAIRCLSISPSTESDWRYVATGSSDERINVYSVSTAPPNTSVNAKLPSLSSNHTAENPRNRSVGSLIHHDRAVTCLQFPAKGKLFSAAEDNTVAISRTRDWTMLSSIKAPIPKPQGRPSGDTAGPGQTPAGVNDFAIHPSQKLMLSVGRGERCLRLWNLMTGKKAGVLKFDRDLLSQVGEGKHSSGEGRNVLWAGNGESYVVGFERGAAVFGVDSQPRALIKPSPLTKLHCYRMMQSADGQEMLAVSTEDGRVLFFNTTDTAAGAEKGNLPICKCVAQLGGRAAGIAGRIKDLEVIELPASVSSAQNIVLLVTASSDGAVRIWTVPRDLGKDASAAQQTGRLLGTLETSNRITCLGAFVLDGKSGDAGAEDEEFGGFEEEDDEAASGEEEE
ncbi:Protein mak11 [Recurvomyces mirabilis]|nr:Protein mak11 [Recurvomyces mirabilis]